MRLACAFLMVSIFMASIVAAQPAADPDALYTRVRQRVIDEISKLPNYTCVQTITRRTYAAPSKKHAPTCDEIIQEHAARKHNLPLVSWDRLRLDVALSDAHEVYSWVGASRFEDRDLSSLVGGGHTNLGDFGSFVAHLFAGHSAMRFEGERKIGVRPLFEYSYQTPLESSRYYVRSGRQELATAFDGSVFLDPASNDVARVTARSAVLREQTGYCQVTKDLDYARRPSDVAGTPIPGEATSIAIDREGAELDYVSAYTGCREYVGESALRFDAPEEQSQPAPSSQPAATPESLFTITLPTPGTQPSISQLPAIPSGLPFECRITTPIDSATAAAGDPIEATLSAPITGANGQVLAPADARIYGRLATFAEHPATPGARNQYWEIGVQFRSIQLNGKRVSFAAALVNDSNKKRDEVHMNLRFGIPTFLIYGKQSLRLAGLEAKWLTATP